MSEFPKGLALSHLGAEQLKKTPCIYSVCHHLNVCHYTIHLSSELWLFNGPIEVAAFSRDWLHLEPTTITKAKTNT